MLDAVTIVLHYSNDMLTHITIHVVNKHVHVIATWVLIDSSVM